MQEITSLSQFNKLKSKGLLVIDFYAHWCGPCKAISPVFERLAKPFKDSDNIIFAKVDVDAAKDVAQVCGISAMPTFQFFKQGAKVDEIRGADVQGLTTKIGYHTSSVSKSSSGSGTKLGESRTYQASSPIASGGKGNLNSLLDVEACKLLSASNRSSIKSIIKPSFAGVAVESAAGPQLLIHLVFVQEINPIALRLSVAEDSVTQAPSKIHLGRNVENPKDLNALMKAETVQSLTAFSDEYVKGMIELKLKAGKFVKTKSLTILVDANIGGDLSTITKVSRIDVIGSK